MSFLPVSTVLTSICITLIMATDDPRKMAASTQKIDASLLKWANPAKSSKTSYPAILIAAWRTASKRWSPLEKPRLGLAGLKPDTSVNPSLYPQVYIGSNKANHLRLERSRYHGQRER